MEGNLAHPGGSPGASCHPAKGGYLFHPFVAAHDEISLPAGWSESILESKERR